MYLKLGWQLEVHASVPSRIQVRGQSIKLVQPELSTTSSSTFEHEVLVVEVRPKRVATTSCTSPSQKTIVY